MLDSIWKSENSENKKEIASIEMPKKISENKNKATLGSKSEKNKSTLQPENMRISNLNASAAVTYESKIPQEKIIKNQLNTKINFPCSGVIDQIEGVSLNHVHITSSINSPSLPPVNGGAVVKISRTIYRDTKNWYKIKYVTNGKEYNGWLPIIYVLPSTDCFNN